MNHIGVFFSDYYNSIFIDMGFLQGQKLAVSWYFNNSFSDKLVFFSYAKSCFLSLKIWKITTPDYVTCWNLQNFALKKDMLRPFLKSAPYMRMTLN